VSGGNEALCLARTVKISSVATGGGEARPLPSTGMAIGLVHIRGDFWGVEVVTALPQTS